MQSLTIRQFYKSLFFLLGILLATNLFGQDTTSSQLNIYLDCNRCDDNHIRRNIDFVNHVRDPEVADVHILVTDQRTGSGRKTIFNFIGTDDGLEFKLELNTSQTQTYSEIRDQIVKILKSGVAPFLAQQNPDLDVNISGWEEMDKTQSQQEPETDPWNNWVFGIASSIGYENEQRRSELELSGRLDADRITREWKIRLNMRGDYEENVFDNDGEKIVTLLKRYRFWGSSVKSLTEHWSAGLFGEVESNTYNNIRMRGGVRAAAEYNIFPYDISNQKEFTFAYYVGPIYSDYFEETIYNKLSEQLWGHTLRVIFRTRQQWGTIYADLEGFHFFHDLSKNHIELNSWISIRLIKGLFFRFGTEVELIRDQLYLPKGEVPLEDLLLERKALQTAYNFELNVGLSYTFGSIYNNIVNTRL